MLERYELDLVLMNSASVRKDMEYQVLFEEELLIAVPQIHPLNEKAVYVEGSRYRNLDLNWLEGENLILQNPNQSIRADVDAALKDAGVHPGKIQVIRNIETAIQMTAEGLGISFNRESYAGNMKYRKAVFDQFIGNGWEAVNIIHPDAVISPEAKIGQGVLVECGCLITPNPVIGNNVVINTGSQVNHDNFVGDHVYIASGVVLSGGVTIEENTLIDDGVVITLGRKVGSNCIIGAGSVVTKDICNDSVAYGVPAKIIRNN